MGVHEFLVVRINSREVRVHYIPWEVQPTSWHSRRQRFERILPTSQDSSYPQVFIESKTRAD